MNYKLLLAIFFLGIIAVALLAFYGFQEIQRLLKDGGETIYQTETQEPYMPLSPQEWPNESPAAKYK